MEEVLNKLRALGISYLPLQNDAIVTNVGNPGVYTMSLSGGIKYLISEKENPTGYNFLVVSLDTQSSTFLRNAEEVNNFLDTQYQKAE